MNLNANFNERVAMHAAKLDWSPSPMKDVDRRMLDRMGDEVARATSIVRYAPNSQFSPHVHSGGEEFLVLEGVFQDEHGNYPAGSYVRNPPQSSHTPGSDQGCTIFVKLWQFDPEDRTHIRIDINKMAKLQLPNRLGVSITPLFRDVREDVRIEYWQPDTLVELDVPGGLELLVLNGDFKESGEIFIQDSWLRLPCGSKLSAEAGKRGAQLWVKSDHLRGAQSAPAANIQ